MSHITHLYHLSALDFINTAAFPGMAPWIPSYTGSGYYASLDGSTGVGSTLVVHYVQALEKRRKMHTAGALFSGRQPICNALVPGGVTTLMSNTTPLTPSATDYDQWGPYNFSDAKSKFQVLLNDVRSFINTTYIPDVITVANAYSAFWSQGVGCGNLLAYGDYPVIVPTAGVTGTAQLLTKRGRVTGTTLSSIDQINIHEYVDNSYYDYGILEGGTGKHPFEGVTAPDMATGYSWLKAPRYMVGTVPTVYEVGPLARMVVTYVSSNQIGVTEDDLPVSQRLLGGALPSPYTAVDLVNAALANVTPAQPVTALYSALGRHAARALEAKFVADAMAGTSGGVTSWIDQIDPNNPAYTYKKLPKQLATGYGLTEAPRGALGHWIKIQGKKVMRYQCVVPTTWNGSPAVPNSSPTPNGAIEDCLIGSTIGTTPDNQIVNILRLIHPFDICIACAVHVVNPEGKEMMKFAINPDGRPTNIEIKK
jgi:hydrogenase large subunit